MQKHQIPNRGARSCGAYHVLSRARLHLSRFSNSASALHRMTAISFFALAMASGCNRSSLVQPVIARGPAVGNSPLPSSEESGTSAGGLPAGAVIYGVIPGLLGTHPFADLKNEMARLHEDGVDAVWISPINSTNEAGSLLSYSVTDYFHLRDDFGTEEEFRDVVREAHRYGIRVLMDFVANHTSDQHPYYLDTVRRGKASPYYDFYDRDQNGEVTHYFDWANLMNLNYANPEVARMIKDACKHWVTDFAVDGFRFDAAWGVRDRAPKFWAALGQELRQANPKVVLLAEASARDPYYKKNGFDLAYDWNDQLGHWAWENVFADRDQIAPRLHVALTSASTSPSLVARFLNNNDTNERFITRFGAGVTRVAAALQFTLPGVPILYAGDEVGAEYLPYQNPSPINWKLDPHHLTSYYRRLIKIRKSQPAIAGATWTPIMPADNPATYAYVRGAESEAPVLVVLNFASRDATVTLPLSEPVAAKFGQTVLTDLISGQKIEVSVDQDASAMRIPVPHETALILVPATNQLADSL